MTRPDGQLSTATDVQAAAQYQASTSDPALIADELPKLASLRDSGILTDDEFNQRKALLLSRI